MNAKILSLIIILSLPNIYAGSIDGGLIKIKAPNLRLEEVSVSVNEVSKKKEGPILANAITYLCTIDDIYVVFREGNIFRSDPSGPDAEVVDSFNIVSEKHHFSCVICVEKNIIIVGILIRQMEYREGEKNGNAIYVSLRGKNRKAIASVIDVLSETFKISFDNKIPYEALGKNGFDKDVIKSRLTSVCPYSRCF